MSSSLANSLRGYLYLGKSATGQCWRGTSILWIYLEWVQASEAAVRPWKAPWKDRTARSGVPGDCAATGGSQGRRLALIAVRLEN
jgi:hypothetical protein